ncbi:MAG: GNAT family N-acetyltransferase [Alphaproteobacteria bacterium]|nr:GNAT family N-acetyltransferase [Alphaproteobacteria bacterium]
MTRVVDISVCMAVDAQSMILYDQGCADIQLVPFAMMRNDDKLRSAYLGWLNDPDVVRPTASPALLGSKGPEFIEQSFARFARPESPGFFVRYGPGKVFIGTAKLDAISAHCRSAWDGIMIGDRRYHGRGLAVAVYRILLAFGFTALGLNRVSGGCNENNVPMVKTFNRLGYALEGRLRQADCIEGVFSDHLYFGILRDEFFAANDVRLGLKKYNGGDLSWDD